MTQHPEEAKRSPVATAYFLILGIGTLISWNGVLNSLDYFKEKFPAWKTDSYLVFAFNIGQFIVTFFSPALSSAFSLGKRIIGPLIILGTSIVVLPFEANVFSDTDYGFFLLLFLFALLGGCTCFFQGTLSGFVSHFPKAYTSIYLMGTGAAGLVMNFLRILAIVTFEDVDDGLLIQIIVYFTVAGVFLITCAIIHPIFINSQYYQNYAKNSPASIGYRSFNEEEEGATTDVNKVSETEPVEAKTAFRNYLEVFSEVKFYVFLLAANFTVSFLVFPGVILQKPTPHMEFKWKMVTLMLAFDISDILGKCLGQLRAYFTRATVVKILIFRLVIDALCILQAVSSDTPIISTLWFGYVNMFMFGLTNGFVVTSAFILSSESVTEKKKDLAGYLAVFGLACGLVLGGILNLPLGNLNPNA